MSCLAFDSGSTFPDQLLENLRISPAGTIPRQQHSLIDHEQWRQGTVSVPLRLESQYGAPFLRPYRSSPIPVMRTKRIFVKETLKDIPLLECEKAPGSLVERSYGSIEKRISEGMEKAG